MRCALIQTSGRASGGARHGAPAVFALLLLPFVAAAGVIDRVAVVVGKTVITESEIQDNLRITEFLNSEPLDLSALQRRAAAERLVDQELLRNEMQVTHFAMPTPAEGNRQYQQLLQQRFANTASYRASLERYGITEDQLKEQLQWQLAVVRFTEFRFRSEVVPASNQSADRISPDDKALAGKGSAGKTAPPPAAQTVDQQMETWLKEARANTRVVLKEEAFQ